MKLYRTDGKLIIELQQCETIKEAVEYCVKNNISLTEANLENADLEDADLRWADLGGANLYRAYLYKADLEKANLQGAYLCKAYLVDANLQGAEGIYTFNKLGGRTCYAVAHDKELMIQADCFWGSLIEFEKACKTKYPDDSVQAYEDEISYLKLKYNKLCSQ